MGDCRAINDDLFNTLKDGGFKEFVNFVRKPENKLALCFRGNEKPNSVVIYYNNHMVWKLCINEQGKLAVTISANHARYTKDWKEKLKILYDQYKFGNNGENKFEDIIKTKKTKIENIFKTKEVNIGYLTSTSDYFNKEFVEGSFSILKPLIDDFFNSDLELDYFKDEKGKKAPHRSSYIEKIRQQELYLEFNNTENGLFVYDLEFAQKSIENIQANNNQPDMLGIEFKDGKPEKLILLEVKSTKAAMPDGKGKDGKEKSGLIKHIKGMEEYKKDTIAINNRIIEVNKILKQYKGLELRIMKDVEEISDIPIEIRVILTDTTDGGAIDYFMRNKKHWEKIKNGDSKNLSKILDNMGYKFEFVKEDRIEIYPKNR